MIGVLQSVVLGRLRTPLLRDIGMSARRLPLQKCSGLCLKRSRSCSGSKSWERNLSVHAARPIGAANSTALKRVDGRLLKRAVPLFPVHKPMPSKRGGHSEAWDTAAVGQQVCEAGLHGRKNSDRMKNCEGSKRKSREERMRAMADWGKEGTFPVLCDAGDGSVGEADIDL